VRDERPSAGDRHQRRYSFTPGTKGAKTRARPIHHTVYDIDTGPAVEL
jgi:hypothetical protein